MAPSRAGLPAAALFLLLVAPSLHAQSISFDGASERFGAMIQEARRSQSHLPPSLPALLSASSPLQYSQVCTGDGAARARRLQAGLAALEPQLRPRFAELAARYGLPAARGDDYVSTTLQSITYTYPYDETKAKEALSAFAEAIERAVMARVALPDDARLKRTLISRIQAKTTLSAQAKAELVRRIGLITMVLPSRYIRDYTSTTEELWPIIPLLVADQAWNASYEDLGGVANPDLAPGQSLIVIYPGILLADDRGDGRSHLDFVVAHEAAHSIDSGRFPGLYDGYIACMKKSGGVDFKAWDEVVADTWAADVLSDSLPQGAPSRALGGVSASFEILCGTSGDGGDSLIGHFIEAEHPSGRYRLERVLGEDAGIRSRLGLPADPGACRL